MSFYAARDQAALRRSLEPGLAAVVGMKDGLALRRPPAPCRHLQGVDHQLGADVIGDGPAHDPAAPSVEDDGYVDLALGGGVLGYVADPQPVRALDAELAVHQVL